jgi:hypothetical protein
LEQLREEMRQEQQEDVQRSATLRRGASFSRKHEEPRRPEDPNSDKAAVTAAATEARKFQQVSGELGWLAYDGVVVTLMIAAVAVMVAYVFSVNSSDTPTTSR